MSTSVTKTEIHVRAQENYEQELHFRKWSQLTPAKWLPYLSAARAELIREARPRDTSADADIDARAQENYRASGAPRGPWDALHPEKQFPYRYIARQELLLAQAHAETPLQRADLTAHTAQLNAAARDLAVQTSAALAGRQDAKLEILARALCETYYLTGLSRNWDEMGAPDQSHWLQAARPVLDAMNAADTEQENNR